MLHGISGSPAELQLVLIVSTSRLRAHALRWEFILVVMICLSSVNANQANVQRVKQSQANVQAAKQSQASVQRVKHAFRGGANQAVSVIGSVIEMGKENEYGHAQHQYMS